MLDCHCLYGHIVRLCLQGQGLYFILNLSLHAIAQWMSNKYLLSRMGTFLQIHKK